VASIVIITTILMLNLVTITISSLNNYFRHWKGSVKGRGIENFDFLRGWDGGYENARKQKA